MDWLKDIPKPDTLKRDEILDILLREEYGYIPEDPKRVTSEIISVDEDFCGGDAEIQFVKLTIKASFGIFSFPLRYVRLKNREKPVPCFIHINFRPDVPDKYQPTEEIVEGGYSVISFCYTDITTDDDDFTTGLAGLVYPNGRENPYQCGKIGLWAWAAMCVMDYVCTLPDVDKFRVAVVGHSRLGKTALLTGALDKRLFCAIANNSGCGGAALFREKTGENIEKIYNRFGYWFCENFKNHINKENELPFDQHFLIAANHPHKVYVGSAAGDEWACPKNEYLACVAANRYYKKRGMSGFIYPTKPLEVGDAFGEGCIGYHLRPGNHYLSRKDWQYFMKFMERP